MIAKCSLKMRTPKCSPKMRTPTHFLPQRVQCAISHQKRAFFFCFAHLFHQVGAQRENRARAHYRTVHYGA